MKNRQCFILICTACPFTILWPPAEKLFSFVIYTFQKKVIVYLKAIGGKAKHVTKVVYTPDC